MFQVFFLIGLFGKVFDFVGIRFVVIEFACLYVARFPVAPLNVAMSFGTDGIAHEVSMLEVAVASEGTRVLAEYGGFPWTIRFLQQRQQANAFDLGGSREPADLREGGVEVDELDQGIGFHSGISLAWNGQYQGDMGR